MSKIIFSEDAWDEYLYWQTQDKKTLRKINKLLKALQREPFTGIGAPEPLSGSLTGKWSRRINDKDRLVYEIQEEDILVIQCKDHYEDK
ncbi:Txe/YoeB family addiction module toxin [Aminicella lysinilytica]|uniref:Endoribonuclease YoeB n=1 Tax=Aminicella lysinilytica TaxID=433323 RepID=A0A4V3CQX3_9FIRM|nr:Txe/YoeB family addiction module toxin [Aminicella lysinilytica]TDP51491.1 toxin YoeB [Aminicella lysinilytica]